MKSKVFWGLSMLLVAAGLIFVGLGVKIGEFMTVGQMIFGVLFLSWTVTIFLTAKTAKRKATALLPLALFYWTEQSVLEYLTETVMIEGWTVAVATVLIVLALNILLPSHSVKKGAHSNSMGEKTVYLDATKQKHAVSSKFGELNVYFENVELADDSVICLDVENKLGEMTVHVPESWFIESSISNRMGEVDVRENTVKDGKKIVIAGSNNMGELDII